MRRLQAFRASAAICTLLIVAAWPGFSTCARAAVSFAGKTITWTVPYPPGGGSGTIAQFFAPLLEKYLPGHPKVVIAYEPGRGSIKGANLFAQRAKPNGLNILITTGSTQLAYLLGDPRVNYSYNDWRILMVMPTGGVVYSSPTLGVKSADELKTLVGRRLVFANQGATSLDLVPLLAFKLLGLNVQHIFGFRGRADGRLAFERGDVNVDYQTTSAYLENVQPLVDAGKAVPLFSWGVLTQKGDLVRDPTFPNLPDFNQVYGMLKHKKPAGADYDAYLAIFTAGFPAQKMIFTPKGTPDDVVAAYEKAFADMRADPDFKARANDILGKYDMATGDEAETLFKRGTTISPASQKTIVKMLADDYGVKVGE